MATQSSSSSGPLTDPRKLQARIDEAEDEVKRLEAAVLQAETPEAADAARRALTRAELDLYDLLDMKDEGCACEGWPRGK